MLKGECGNGTYLGLELPSGRSSGNVKKLWSPMLVRVEATAGLTVWSSRRGLLNASTEWWSMFERECVGVTGLSEGLSVGVNQNFLDSEVSGEGSWKEIQTL